MKMQVWTRLWAACSGLFMGCFWVIPHFTYADSFMYFSKKKLDNIYKKEKKSKHNINFLKFNQFNLPAKIYQNGYISLD